MKLLVLCLPAIGDGLMSTPLIKVLRKKYPRAQIDVACMMEGVKYIYKNNPNINHVHLLSIYSGSKLKGLSQVVRLRKEKYDVSILAFPSYRREYHWVQFAIGAKRRISHLFSSGYWLEFNFLNTDLIAVDETSHNVINNLNLSYALAVNWREYLTDKEVRYYLKLDTSDVRFGREYLKKLGWMSQKTLAFHPGSTNSPAALLRRWPTEHYAQLAKYLIKRGYKVLVFVGPEETDIGIQLQSLTNSKNCHLVTNVRFSQSLGILSQVRLLICNDNGFGHLANALGKKIVTMWASTNDKWSLPINNRLVTLVRAPMFIPWYRYILKRDIPKGMVGGMEKITTNEVIRAIEMAL